MTVVLSYSEDRGLALELSKGASLLAAATGRRPASGRLAFVPAALAFAASPHCAWRLPIFPIC